MDIIIHNEKYNKFSKNHDKQYQVSESDTIYHSEVATPYKLRKLSLSKLPLDFWIEPRKIIEPSCGKGGYLIDIIHLFMIGLKILFENVEERYKFIVEEWEKVK